LFFKIFFTYLKLATVSLIHSCLLLTSRKYCPRVCFDEMSVFEMPGVRGGLNLPTVFSTPFKTLSKYVLGVSYILYTYSLHHNFARAPTVEKFNPPPANYTQFEHCKK